ncbi:hypothetical protein CK203_043594 [Vitis vinifera]|uniref:Retrotransposon gag domain-containing protein n=1 Tax=Vitis vinifera TaxID=29760 RepID=A0A438HYG8_VITVI|nr:hypothetical protein CK203_043594 [Vitis vinifera]
MLSLSLFALIVIAWFSDAPTPLTTYSSRPLSVESFKSFTIGNPLGYRGSACVEVMTILHGSIPSIRRRVEGCVPLEGTIASARDPLKSTSLIFRATLTFQTEVAPHLVTLPIPTSKDPYACMDRLEQRLRQLRTPDEAITWEDFDRAPMASLPAKFKMPEIERYMGIGCPRIHLRLYSTIMRAYGLDETQMVMLFPMSLSGAAQRWFASLDVSRCRTWDDLT